jgi:hypothetical protein
MGSRDYDCRVGAASCIEVLHFRNVSKISEEGFLDLYNPQIFQKHW